MRMANSERRIRRPRGKLAGKAVLITGASRGIGLAIARALDSEGARLILVGRNRGPLARAAKQIPGTVMSVPADVTQPGDVKRLIAALRKQIRRLDVLINNAGVFTFKPFAKTTLEDWRRSLETNLTSIFLTTQAALPLLKRSQGDVVNILSISSRVAFPNCSAYAAAKFGARGLTGVLRRELRAEGIRVMAVLPGMTETRMKDELNFPVRGEDLLQPEDVAAAVLSALVQPRHATVEEILIMPSRGALGGEN
jgi:NADP-dependent 3-hydroxy acid dehydrogenase YdfG